LFNCDLLYPVLYSVAGRLTATMGIYPGTDSAPAPGGIVKVIFNPITTK